jgi:hypothetical protein
MAHEKTLSQRDLDDAVSAGVISTEDAGKLMAFAEARRDRATPQGYFDLTHVIWYAGSLIIMSAMGLFATTAFAAIGGYGLALTGIIYMIGLGLSGNRLWQRAETRLPGGLLLAAAISMTPLIVYGLQEASGIWGQPGRPGDYASFYKNIRAGFIPMEIVTLLVTALALRLYAFAFLALPAAICLWFLSMDIAELFATHPGFQLRRDVSLWFGLILIGLLLVYERKPRASDAAFWITLVAAITFWAGLSLRDSDSHLAKAAYCAINVGLVGFSVFVGRRVYAVLGVIGVMVYLGDLAWTVFKNSLLFPYLLSMVGIALVVLGLAYAKRQKAIVSAIEVRMPEALKALRPYRVR